MTYGEIRRGIQTATSNTDSEFISQIDLFIKQTESRIGMLVRLPAYSATASLVTVAGVNTIALNSLTPQFISADYLNLLDFGTLEQKEKSFMFEAFPNNGEQGPPRYFGLQDDLTVVLGPTPDAIYNLTLYYFSKWGSIVDL